jgi:hypothetical protein
MDPEFLLELRIGKNSTSPYYEHVKNGTEESIPYRIYQS